MWNLQKESQICLQQVQNMGIEYGKIESFQSKTDIKSYWGQCERIPLNDEGPAQFKITINSRLLSGDVPIMSLRATIIHEIIHTCDGCFNHGRLWKHYCKQLSDVYGYNLSRTTSAKEIGIKDPTERISVPEKIPDQRTLHLIGGEYIYHEDFGSGLVVGVKPIGKDAMLDIIFMDGSRISLMQKLASPKIKVEDQMIISDLLIK